MAKQNAWHVRLSEILAHSRNGHLDILHSLLDASADMDKGDHQGITPLYTAAEHGNLCIAPQFDGALSTCCLLKAILGDFLDLCWIIS
jgi:ankyrin repeat protein